jgi:Flp pilus assembly protein TadG
MRKVEPNSVSLAATPLTRHPHSIARLVLSDEGGQVLPWVVVVLLVILGISALVVDIGRAMVVQRQLQASADAAALAAAETVSGTSTTFETVAASYSAGSSDKNAYNGVSVGTPTVTPLCLTTVSNWGYPCTTSGGTVSVPNAVSVTESASVPTLFAAIFGKPSVTVSATSTAARGRPIPYNIALIVDSTISMTSVDSNCNSLTQEQCAMNGMQQLLSGLSTTYDDVALFTFPNVAAGASQAGIVESGDYTCTSTVPSSYKGSSYSYQAAAGGYITMLWTPAYMQPYPGIAWAMPYTFPPIPASTSGYAIASGSYAPTYELTPFLADYNTAANSLNTSSNLVKAVGGVSGCGGMAPSNYDGNYGTYYAGAIYAAQAALLKQQTLHANSSNVMIVLGDGNSDGPPPSSSPNPSTPSIPTSPTQSETTYASTSSLNTEYTLPSTYMLAEQNGGGVYPSQVGQCGQAVIAAQYAANYSSGGTPNPTWIFTIAYGALSYSSAATDGSGACDTDVGAGSHPNITPCQTLQQMATQQSGYTISPSFYSDYTATGGDAGCQANSDNSGITAISDIYNAIKAKLSKARLIPNGTT